MSWFYLKNIKNKVQFEQFLKARQTYADADADAERKAAHEARAAAEIKAAHEARAAAELKAENVKSKLENDANYKIQFLSLLCKIRALSEEYNNIEPGFGSSAKENGLKFLYKELMVGNQHMVQDMESIFSNSKEALDINRKLYDDIYKTRNELRSEAYRYNDTAFISKINDWPGGKQ